jgi:hypothetical protein
VKQTLVRAIDTVMLMIMLGEVVHFLVVKAGGTVC